MFLAFHTIQITVWQPWETAFYPDLCTQREMVHCPHLIVLTTALDEPGTPGHCSSALLPGCHALCSLPLHCLPHDVSATEPPDYGLNLLKLGAKLNLSPFKLWLLGPGSQQQES